MNGAERKQEGMDRVSGNNAEWTHAVVGNLMAYCKARKQLGLPSFKVEDFRKVAEASGWPMPNHPNAWGCLPRIACKHGLIAWTGEHEMAQRPNAHHRYVKVWRML